MKKFALAVIMLITPIFSHGADRCQFAKPMATEIMHWKEIGLTKNQALFKLTDLANQLIQTGELNIEQYNAAIDVINFAYALPHESTKKRRDAQNSRFISTVVNACYKGEF